MRKSISKLINKQGLKASISISFMAERYWRARLSPSDIRLYDNAIRDLKGLNQIDKFINDNITYRKDRIDIWHIPEATFKLGYGDCDEYAVMAYDILKKTGLRAWLLVVYTLSSAHMVCVYEIHRKLSHISNWGNYMIMKDDMKDVIDSVYSDWILAYVIEKEPGKMFNVLSEEERDV